MLEVFVLLISVASMISARKITSCCNVDCQKSYEQEGSSKQAKDVKTAVENDCGFDKFLDEEEIDLDILLVALLLS